MSLSRTVALLRKDLKLGPRSPLFLWVLVLPLVMTLLIQGVFGGLFEPRPRLGVVDGGASAITAALQELPGIQLVLHADAAELKRRVEAHDVDAGLVLKPGFDEALRAGERPLLELYLSGESLAANRVMLAVTTLDLVRAVAGKPPPVAVEVVQLGDGAALPIADRLVPLLVMYALLVAGVFVTSFSLVEERENRTLNALLVTPVALPEVLLAKSALGLLLALLMAAVTLALNGVLTQSAALLLALLVGAVMSVEIGLLYAAAAKDIKALYTLIKSLNIFLLAPVIFYLFPDWPQWIAKLFPTYWFVDPIFQVAIRGASLGDVAGTLLVAVIICLALVPILWLLTRRVAV